MAFTKEYLSLCYQYRTIYQHKRRIKGDWYANIQTGDLKVYDGESEERFKGPEWFYVPDLDDLFEFLHIQIRQCQETDLPAETIALTCNPETKWELEIALKNGLRHKSVNGNSAHEVLLQAIYAMSAFVVTETDPEKRREIFFMKQKYRELASQMEIEMEDGMWDNGDDGRECTSASAVGKHQEDSQGEESGFFTDLVRAWKEVRKLRRGSTHLDKRGR